MGKHLHDLATPEELKKLSRSVWRTWEYIGSDAMEFITCDEEAIEMCVDADRLSECGKDPESNALVTRIAQAGAYREMMKWLMTEHRFV